MLQNISVINFLIYSVGIGFIAAIIFTNIQRSALSLFINSLIENNCVSDDSAKTLSELGLKGIYFNIAFSSVKNQYGLKKSITTVLPEKPIDKDDVDAYFDRKNSTKYFICEECDKEALKKRYNYKSMSTKMLLLLIAALIAVVVLATLLADMIIENVVISKSKSPEADDTKVEEEVEINDETENIDFEVEDNFEDNSDETITSDEEVYTPRVPVS